MKFFIMSVLLTMFAPNAFPSCLVRVEPDATHYHVIVWKHSDDGTQDTVNHSWVSKTKITELERLMENEKQLTLIYNAGSLTALRFEGGKGKKLADMSTSEKDAADKLSSLFNVNEK